MCKRCKLRGNESNNKVMKCIRTLDGNRMNIVLNGEFLEEVECSK